MNSSDISAEMDRLEEVASLNFQIDQLQNRLHPYINLAKSITQTPACEINIINAFQQWTIAGTNGRLKLIPRKKSICHDTIQHETAHEIENLTEHERYQDRFYVSGAPHFRYYCGVQLTTSNNEHVGVLCVLDKEAKQLTKQQKQQLNIIADAVIDVIENESTKHQLAHQLHQMRDDLRKLNHDVRGPINGIVGLADIVQDYIEESPQALKMLKSIRDCGHTILEQIDMVLNNNSPSTDINPFQRVDISSIKDRILKLYGPQAESKSIILSVENQCSDLQISYLSLNTAVKIIGNLVSNGLKFSASGGHVWVELSLTSNAEVPCLLGRVSDDGKGMSQKQVRAFNSGEDVERSTGTAGEQSFGIGLKHVRNLVRNNDGTITARTGSKPGTTFELMLPLEQ